MSMQATGAGMDPHLAKNAAPVVHTRRHKKGGFPGPPHARHNHPHLRVTALSPNKKQGAVGNIT